MESIDEFKTQLDLPKNWAWLHTVTQCVDAHGTFNMNQRPCAKKQKGG